MRVNVYLLVIFVALFIGFALVAFLRLRGFRSQKAPR
jgi:hypothetical protein